MLNALKSKRICSLYPIETLKISQVLNLIFPPPPFFFFWCMRCFFLSSSENSCHCRRARAEEWNSAVEKGCVLIQAISNCISVLRMIQPTLGLLWKSGRWWQFHLLHPVIGLAVSLWPKNWRFPSYCTMILCCALWCLILCFNFMTKCAWCMIQMLFPAAFH